MKQVLCTHYGSATAWFLRFVMWSKWSHSAVYDEQTGWVYDTTFLQGGCKRTQAGVFFKRYPKFEITDMGLHDEGGAAKWLEAQLGKPYDWTALLSFIVQRDWQEDDKWFCSEWTETCRSLFGTRRFRGDLSRITPGIQALAI